MNNASFTPSHKIVWLSSWYFSWQKVRKYHNKEASNGWCSYQVSNTDVYSWIGGQIKDINSLY